MTLRGLTFLPELRPRCVRFQGKPCADEHVDHLTCVFCNVYGFTKPDRNLGVFEERVTVPELLKDSYSGRHYSSINPVNEGQEVIYLICWSQLDGYTLILEGVETFS